MNYVRFIERASARTIAFVVVVFLIPFAAQAALYAPGATLDPGCAPTDNTCGIATTTASIGTGVVGQVPYYAAAGSALTATSSLIILQNGYVGIGTTSPSALLSVAGNGYFGGNLNVGDATTTRSNLGLPYASVSQNDWYNITAWGDSITAGNEDGTGVTYPNQLAADIPGSVVNNEGVGGQTSTQIGVREGGVSTTATVSGGTIPSSGSVTVTFPTGYEPVTSQGPSPGAYGTIAGVYGLVTLSGSIYTFNVLNGTTTVSVSGAVRFIPNTGSLNNGTVIIWAGRNNSGSPSQVESDIAAMVAALPSNRYLILSILNAQGEGSGTGAYSNITTINNYLASTYPGHYFDIREYLVQNGLAAAGLTATASDTADVASDVVPYSLSYAGSVHLNAAGYTVVAEQVANWIKNFNSSNEAVVTYPLLTGLLANTTLPGLIIASTTLGVPSGSVTPISTVAPLFTVASGTAATSPGLTVLSNGMTGFGTSTPNSVVQIEGPNSQSAFTGTAHLGLFLTSNSYGMSGLDFGGLNSSNPEARIAMSTGASGSYLQFGTTNSWTSGITNTAVTIDYKGRVGIGTTSPLAMLDIAGQNNGSSPLLQLSSVASYATTTQLIVTNSGLVGIGSTTPGSLLSLGNANGINFSTATTTFNSTGGINIAGGCFSIAGTCLGNGSGFSNTLANGGTGTTTFASGGLVYSNGAMLTQTAATLGAALYWDSANNSLGIGTTTPISPLHVLSRTAISSFTGASNEVVTIDGSGYTGIDFNDAGGVGDSIPKARIAMNENSSGSYLDFGTTNNWSGGISNTAITIDYLGRVGVGTTTPVSVLQVEGPSSAGAFSGTTHLGLFTTSKSYGMSGIDFGGLNSINPEARIAMSTGTGGSYLEFGTSNAYTSGITNTAMVIDYKGDLGIGTTSPLATLDVAGQNNGANPLFQLSSVSSYATTTRFIVNSSGNAGVGTASPYAPLEVWAPSSGATTTAFIVANSASTTAFAVYDNGNATYSGSIFQSSDERLKTDVTPLDASSSLAAIEGLTPVSYLRIDQPDTGTNLGFIAQAVRQIFPELVSTTSPTALTPDGTLTLNYTGLIAPIIASIQQLAGEVDGLAQSITTNVLTAVTGNFQTGNFSQQVCVGSTCINQSQLQQLLQESGQLQSATASDENASSTADGTSTTTADATATTTAVVSDTSTVDSSTSTTDDDASSTDDSSDIITSTDTTASSTSPN